MKRRMIGLVMGAFTVSFFIPCAEAKPKKDKDFTVNDFIEKWFDQETPQKKHNHPKSWEKLDSWDALRAYLLDYQKSGKKGLPPGLAKKVARGSDLPPGWQKKVYPGATFPTDLFSRAKLLNYTSIPRFGTPKEDEGFYALGDKIFKVYQPTRKVLDILNVN